MTNSNSDNYISDTQNKQSIKSIKISYAEIEINPSDVDCQILLDNGNTDMSTALAWLKSVKYNFVYDNYTEQWYYWNGKYWEEDLQKIHEKSMIIFSELVTTAISVYSDHVREVLHKIVGSLRRASKWNGHFKVASALSSIYEFDQKEHLLNLKNGTLDIDVMKLLPHQKENHLSSMLELEYNINADCPQWSKLMYSLIQIQCIQNYQ